MIKYINIIYIDELKKEKLIIKYCCFFSKIDPAYFYTLTRFGTR